MSVLYQNRYPTQPPQVESLSPEHFLCSINPCMKTAPFFKENQLPYCHNQYEDTKEYSKSRKLSKSHFLKMQLSI